VFEIRVMVEDSKLHKVLWALDGLIVGMPQMLPVRNAVASKDKTKVKEKLPHGASLITRLYDQLGGSGASFNWPETANIMEKLGASSESTGAYLTLLVKKGKIIRIAKGSYKVV